MTTLTAANDRLRIIVLGYVVRGPIGGMAWSDLHYLLGFRDLGHDVWFLEDSDDYASCVDPVRNTIGTDPTYGLRFASALFEQTGLGKRWAYHDAHTGRWHGPAARHARATFPGADLLVNLAGVNPVHPWLETIPHRVLVDKDPVFTQLRHIVDPVAGGRARAHTSFFTFAENVGDPTSSIPEDGLEWQPTRHPIWLPGWPVTPTFGHGRYTTVMQWESYPPHEHEGVRYGVKADSFEAYLELPQRVEPELEVVLGGSPGPRQLLREHGWHVRDGREAIRDAWAYRAYIRGSRAEFTVAKQAYARSASGWFSERSASYLATGRPVVTQETGFSQWLPSGVGVVPFSSPEEAVAGVADVERRYAVHRQAARELAAEYFDSAQILGDLIERATAPRELRGVRTAERAR